MKVIVRMYWQHDLDLIALAQAEDFRIGKKFKEMLIAYAEGDTDFKIRKPDLSFLNGYNVFENQSTHFSLNPKTDQKAIEALRSIRSGYRNAALKAMFRHYLSELNIEPFLNDTGLNSKSRRTGHDDDNIAHTAKPSVPKKSEPKKTVVKEEILDETIEEVVPVVSKEVPENVPAPIVSEPLKEDGGDGEEFDLFSAVDKILGD